MDHKKVLEKALRIQRKISALGLNVRVGVGLLDNDREAYLYLKQKAITKHFCDEVEKKDEAIIKMAKEMCKPKFMQLKKLCVDSFGIDLYLDKQEAVRVKSILSKEIALLTDDREVKINRLFMKEN